MESKNIIASKTLWLNILGPLFLFAANKYGINIDTETQLQISLVVMGLANAVVRRFTSQPVSILPTK